MDDPMHRMERILEMMAGQADDFRARVRKAAGLLSGPLETDIGATPFEIVYKEDRVRLKHYKPEGSPNLSTPLLIVYALINRETMLDLQPGRSVVQIFLKAGIDVYMVDWGYPTRKDRHLTIEDHVCGYMDNIVDFIRGRCGVGKVNLMGICMGGTFSAMYAALFPRKVKNLVTTVAPTNFDTDKGLLHLWVPKLDVDRLVDAFGNMPGDMLNFIFLLMNPARLMIDKYIGFLENAGDREFVENFLRMEKWIFDSPDVPGDTFRQFVKDCYRDNLLIQGRMMLGDRRVDLSRITMPVLNIFARHDHLVPPEAAEMLVRKVGSADAENVCLDTGHIGIYVSGKVQKEFAPRIARFLAERDGPGKAPARKPRKSQERKGKSGSPGESGGAARTRS